MSRSNARCSADDIPENIRRRMPKETRPSHCLTGLPCFFSPLVVESVPENGRESALLAECCRELTARGIVYLHLSHRAREHPGWPDLVFCIRGVPCAVELKSESGWLDPQQVSTLDHMQRNGWHTAVCRSIEKFRAFCRWGHQMCQTGYV